MPPARAANPAVHIIPICCHFGTRCTTSRCYIRAPGSNDRPRTACSLSRDREGLRPSSSGFRPAEIHTELSPVKQSGPPSWRAPQSERQADLGRRCTSPVGKYEPHELPDTIHPPPADGRRETENRNRGIEGVNTRQ